MSKTTQLTPEELRVGNLVRREDGVFDKIFMIRSDMLKVFGLWGTGGITKSVSPIPFTEAWAEAFGFEINALSNPKTGITRHCHKKEAWLALLEGRTAWAIEIMGTKQQFIFNHVHHFQNAIFYLNNNIALPLVENWREIVEAKAETP